MIERLVATLLGGFFAWLGYRLFLDVTSKQTSSGEFKLPSGVAVHLTRVGPGIFFALFGAAVVCYSLYSRVTIDRTQTGRGSARGSAVADAGKQPAGEPASAVVEQVKFTGLGSQDDTSARQLDLKRNERRNYVKFLNSMSAYLEAKRGAPELKDYKNTLPQIQLALLDCVWDEKNWGSKTAFQDWLIAGAPAKEAPQNGKQEPYVYFNEK
jgi:hypothetical protein